MLIEKLLGVHHTSMRMSVSMDACLWMHVCVYGCTVSMDALCLYMHCVYGCTVSMDALCLWMHVFVSGCNGSVELTTVTQRIR
jgi:hypothetical protein